MHPAATLLKGNLEHVVGRQSSVQHRCRTSGVKPVKCLAKRLPKNPSDFKNYDDLREHLHSKHAGFSMSDVLNWLSNNAFGASRSTANGSFAAAYQWLVKKREPQMSRLQAKLEEVPKVQQEEHVAKVAEVLLCEPWLVHRMAWKMPELLSMERMALARRLLLLKRLLPECDVAQLVELQPCWLLQQPDDVVTTQLQRSRQQLLQSLPGSLFSRMWRQMKDFKIGSAF
eukprot:jgi/Astpho2/986/Aster-00813